MTNTNNIGFDVISCNNFLSTINLSGFTVYETLCGLLRYGRLYSMLKL